MSSQARTTISRTKEKGIKIQLISKPSMCPNFKFIKSWFLKICCLGLESAFKKVKMEGKVIEF